MSRLRVPHTLALLFGILIVAQLATYLLPAGQYQRITNDHGREEVVAGSYEPLDVDPVLPWHTALSSIPRGLEAAAEIIFFVFVVGGAIAVLRKTGAIDALIGKLLELLGGKPGALIVGGILVFGIGSSTIGMAEEYIPFIPILLILARGLGFDAITAVGMLCVGYAVGYGSAIMNPFTLLIAQDVAGLEPTSGMALRMVLFVVCAIVGIHHVWSYARNVKADPANGFMHEIEKEAAALAPSDHPEFTGRHTAILILLGAVLVLMVWGIQQKGWYLHELMALFLGLSIVLAIMGKISVDETAKSFCEGAAELTTTALLIGVARSTEVVLNDAQVIDTIVHAISQPLGQMGASLAAVGMFGVQSLANFFIPSGSGQAYVTMPLMAPLADVVGVQRQVAVLAYQMGDGFTNILVPTNAVLMGILGLAAIPYDRWFRFIMPFMVKMWVIGSIALIIAVKIGWS